MNLNIPTNERLIVALDVSSYYEALQIVNAVEQADVKFFKLGLEFLTTSHYFDMIECLKLRGFKVFADLKFYDIPETVYRATKGLVDHGVDFITVHSTPQNINAAVRATQGTDTRVLAVTVLTSIDHYRLEEMGITCTIEDLVISRAIHAMKEGADGVVCSGLEAKLLREQFGDDVGLIVTPGIRSSRSVIDDQRRTVTVQEAFENGSDYVVVGRPIRDVVDRYVAADWFQQQIKLTCQKQS